MCKTYEENFKTPLRRYISSLVQMKRHCILDRMSQHYKDVSFS